MKCENCSEVEVKPPDILCSACTHDIGGHAFLMCVRCQKSWGVLSREDGSEIFPVIPGKTYRSTCCPVCSGPAANFKILEESEARAQINFATALDKSLRLKRVMPIELLLLKGRLENKLRKVLHFGVRSKAAFDVGARIYLAMSLRPIILSNGPWLFALLPGRGHRAASIDCINLEDL